MTYRITEWSPQGAYDLGTAETPHEVLAISRGRYQVQVTCPEWNGYVSTYRGAYEEDGSDAGPCPCWKGIGPAPDDAISVIAALERMDHKDIPTR